MIDHSQINLIHAIFTDIARTPLIAVQFYDPSDVNRLSTVIAINLKAGVCSEIYINFDNISTWRLNRFNKLKSKVSANSYIKTFGNTTQLGFTSK